MRIVVSGIASAMGIFALACAFDTGGGGGQAASIGGGTTDNETTGIDSSVSASSTVTATTIGTEGTGPSSTQATDDPTFDPSQTGTTNTGETEGPEALAFSHQISIANASDFEVIGPQLLVELGATIRWATIDSDLGNLRFVGRDAEVDVELPFEVDVAGEDRASLWVRVPEVSNTFSDFVLEYGEGVDGGPAAPGTVWPTFEGVWHLTDDPAGPAPPFRDSAAGAHHLDDGSGNVLTNADLVDGVVGRALRFGNNRELQGATWPGSNITDAFTAEGWVLLESTPENVQRDILGKNNAYRLTALRNSGSNTEWDHAVGVIYEENDAGPPIFHGAPAEAASPTGTWVYVVMVFEASVKINVNMRSRMTLYIDGEVSRVQDDPVFAPNPTLSDFRIGRDIPGLVDEVRIAPVARDARWVALQYRSMRRDLLTLGPPVPLR